jgi:hypothetical protein
LREDDGAIEPNPKAPSKRLLCRFHQDAPKAAAQFGRRILRRKVASPTVLLAGISVVWRRIVPLPPAPARPADIIDDMVEEAPSDYSWVPYFLLFLVVAVMSAVFTGWRLLLFPPLVVIAFEMFAHARSCPWAGRPLILPIACALSAAAGVLLVNLLGPGPLAAACSIAFGSLVLRIFDLHIPPALAAGLLPFVMTRPTFVFPVAVAAGTLILTLSFLAWRRLGPIRLPPFPWW